MSFDAPKFYRDHGIDCASSGHKRTRSGWVQINCPFCGTSYGLGFAPSSGAYNCWHCGPHDQVKVIQSLLNCSVNQALQTLAQYKGRPVLRNPQGFDVKPQRRRECDWPLGTGPMTDRHRAYLARRGYDPDRLEATYGLRGTGPVGDYKHRVILPIHLDGKMISYQGRDITGKCEAGIKYMACPKELEVMDHKHSLYAIDLVKGDAAAIVEGAADCWRLGPGAVGTFGTGFTKTQQNLFRKRFKRGFVLFDPEPVALRKAERCAAELAVLGLQMELIELDEEGVDPGDLPQQTADYIMRDLGLGGWNQ